MGLDGKRLKALRENKGVSPSEVAKYLKISRQAYIKYEDGGTEIPRTLDKLCDFFQTTPNFLMGYDNTPYYMINDTEKYIIGSFRRLKEDGRKAVLTILELELSRISPAKKEKNSA